LFVARSLALHCAGLRATEADEQVWSENENGIKGRQTVAIYRKRLHDRHAALVAPAL